MPAFIPDVPYHVQLVFILTFSYIWLSAFTNDPDYNNPMPEDTQSQMSILQKNTWQSIYSCVLFMVSFAYLQPYIETVQNIWMKRFNRCIVAVTLFYSCWLIFMLNQRPTFGRKTLGFLDSRLNKVIQRGMHTYDDECDFTLENLWNDMDHYYLVHWCDWFIACFLFRDAYILHFWHLFDEIIELSAQHRLPHFRECWWDHIFTDILLSNIPAVCLGLFVLDKLGVRRYDWLGRNGKNSIWEWEVFHCHRRYGNVLFQLVAFSLHFLDSFFLMNAFLIPPMHLFPPGRLLMWAGFGAIGFRESYKDIETWNTPGRKDHPVESRYRWLASAILVTEILIAYKYRDGTGHITDVPTPWYIWAPWTLSAIILIGGYLYLRFKPGHTVKYPEELDQEVKSDTSAQIRNLSNPSPRKLGPRKQKNN